MLIVNALTHQQPDARWDVNKVSTLQIPSSTSFVMEADPPDLLLRSPKKDLLQKLQWTSEPVEANGPMTPHTIYLPADTEPI